LTSHRPPSAPPTAVRNFKAAAAVEADGSHVRACACFRAGLPLDQKPLMIIRVSLGYVKAGH
jgi:hypothetical protein